MMLISEELRNSLWEQYGHEVYNSNFYLYISAFLKNKGLDGLAKHFYGQHDEEISHSLLIHEFLTDMSADFISVEINRIDFPINNISEIAYKYLEREQATTRDLEEIKSLCIDEGAGVAEEFLREMVSKQRNELAEALTFLDNSELCGGDIWKFKVWSDSLGGD